MVLLADQDRRPDRPAGRTERPLRLHRGGHPRQLIAKLDRVLRSAPAIKCQPRKKPFRNRIGILADIKEIASGCRDESGDPRQEADGIGTMKLENGDAHSTSIKITGRDLSRPSAKFLDSFLDLCLLFGHGLPSVFWNHFP